MAKKNTNLLDKIVEILNKEKKTVTQSSILSRALEERNGKYAKMTPGAVSRYCREKGIL